MPVTIERHVGEQLRADLLCQYREAFEPLRALTATKQTLADHEFSGLLDYDATTLFVSRGRDGRLTGFAVGVSDLKLIPWINPEYFARQFPDLYETGRIVYMPCFVVDPAHQKGTTFMSIAREVSSYYGAMNAMVAMDCCQHNVDVEQFPSILATVAGRSTPTVLHELDRQTYWGFELGGDD